MTCVLLDVQDLISTPYQSSIEPIVGPVSSIDRHDLFGRPLTPREWQILAETAAHGSQKEAAACIGLSVQTLKNHLSGVYSKLGVTSIGQALYFSGWMTVPDSVPHHSVLPVDSL